MTALFVAGTASASPRQVAIRVHHAGRYPDKLRIAPGNAGYGSSSSKDAPSSAAPWHKPSRVHRPAVAPVPEHGLSNGLGTVLLAVMLAGLLVATAWMLSRRQPLPAQASDGTLPDEGAAPAPVELLDPDALAADGRFEEAMGAVLLRALESVGWTLRDGAGTTAREVVRALDRADARRNALGDIVRRAESVHFGGAAATRERYDEMRALLERLTPLEGAS